MGRYEDSLAGKRVVITGGASGIGLGTVLRFLDEKSKVIVIDKNKEKLQLVLERFPDIQLGIHADVSQFDEITSAFQKIDEVVGGIDVLIANAGASMRHEFVNVTHKEYRTITDTNIGGVFFMAQEAAKRMRAQNYGVILMTSSTNAIFGHAMYAPYNASKAAVVSLAQTLAHELAPYIRVNAVCPGYIMTPMQLLEYTPEMMEQVNQRIPMKRHGEPYEIASMYAFLASSEAKYITGQAFSVDGGETA